MTDDDSQYEENTKLIDCRDASFVGRLVKNNSDFDAISGKSQIFNSAYSNRHNENSVVSSSDANRSAAESEVKSLKEWLLLHNDLIQQQSEDILEKDRQIYLLQKENEMLKDRLLCIEKGVPYLPQKRFNDPERVDVVGNSLGEEMTQDPSEDLVTCSLEARDNYQANRVENEAESRVDTTIDEDNITVDEEVDCEFTNECAKDSLSEFNFTVNDFCEFDPVKNIKMSIRRKRVRSLTGFSAKEKSFVTDKMPTEEVKRKKRGLVKDNQIQTTKDLYFVHTPNDDVDLEIDPTRTNTLEVPSWRIKHYSSCYTMEGTENLDDEVYMKRHTRLEADERRRKRWDVQRIREQRVIEKLKLRQERIANGPKNEREQELIRTLWPTLDDVKCIEVTDELPISAFGHPIPKLSQSDFILPWLDKASLITRRSPSKRLLERGKRSRTRV